MPFYTLKCQDCGNNFDVQASLKEKEQKEASKFNCPKCQSKNTVFKFNLSNIIKKDNSSQGSCCPGGGCCG
jgi:putative FmdB family regulatory protein